MSKRHYIPEIEEFHKGFEFEYKPRIRGGLMSYVNSKFEYVDRWETAMFRKELTIQDHFQLNTEPPRNILDIEQYLIDGAIRVKHLDREDIESFEFIKSGLAKDVFILKETHDIQGIGENYIIGINFKEGTDYVQVFYTRDEERAVGAILFAGRLKNKSELKRILKQIGV